MGVPPDCVCSASTFAIASPVSPPAPGADSCEPALHLSAPGKVQTPVSVLLPPARKARSTAFFALCSFRRPAPSVSSIDPDTSRTTSTGASSGVAAVAVACAGVKGRAGDAVAPSGPEIVAIATSIATTSMRSICIPITAPGVDSSR